MSIRRLLGALDGLDPPATAEEIADAIWLAKERNWHVALRTDGEGGESAPPASVQEHADESTALSLGEAGTMVDLASAKAGSAHFGAGSGRPASPAQPGALLYVPPRGRPAPNVVRLHIRTPTAPALPGSLAIARSLRPLRRRVASNREFELDEEATAGQIAETSVWAPTLRPKLERWLDLALVVDTSTSMVVWRRSVAEFRTILEQVGAFRDIRVWTFDSDQVNGDLTLRPESGRERATARSARELIDPAGRRVVLVVADCIGAAWQTGAMMALLERWGHVGPVALAHTLPQRLWTRCAPRFARVRLRARGPGTPNVDLDVRARESGIANLSAAGLAIPVMELEPRWLGRWALLVSGAMHEPVDATVILTRWSSEPAEGNSAAPVNADPDELSPADQVARFRATVPPAAYDLARYLSASPLSLPVMRLVQRVMFADPRPAHLAEVFLSGLLRRVGADGDVAPDDVLYDFHEGIRGVLLGTLTRAETVRILREVSEYISERIGSPVDFKAIIAPEGNDWMEVEAKLGPAFAEVALTVLRSLGGRYLDLAERIRPSEQPPPSVPTQRSGAPPGPATEPMARGAPDGESVETPVSENQPGETVTTSTVEIAEPSLARPAARAIIEGVPLRNPHFTGRQELLEQLETLLQGEGPATALVPGALHGLGGVGKTQLAAEYVYRHAAEYHLIAWIPSEKDTVIRNSLARLAPLLGIPESGDMERTALAVRDALSQGRPYDRWLLIFDNADRPDQVTRYFPYASRRMHVLVTSRNPNWAEVADAVEVQVFSRDESVQLINRRGQNTISPREADLLAEKLGDLPLAVDHAAVWRAQTGMPIEEYLRLIDEQLSPLLADDVPVGNYPQSVARSWQLALDVLHEKSPAAAQLLTLCAFFGSAPIPMWIFHSGAYALEEPLGSTARDPIMRRRAVRELGGLALARIDAVGDRLQVHRLIQGVIRESLDPEVSTITRRSVHQLLAIADPGEPDDPSEWNRYGELERHAIPAGLIEGETPEVRQLLVHQMRYLYRRGDYEGSRDLAQRVSERWRDKLGANDRQTLQASHHLANALRALGQIGAARRLNEESLALLRTEFGEADEQTLMTANSHGADLRLLGDFKAAHELDEDSLNRHRALLGEDHPNTLRAANNLAIDLRLLGRFAEARLLDEDTVRWRQQRLPWSNSEILSSASNLARDLFGLGEYTEARRQLEDTVPRFREALGEDHPTVLLAIRTLAATLRKLGLREQARAMGERNLELYRERLGDDHPETIAAMTSLANDLRVAGELRAARTLGETALRSYRKVLGEDHPFTHVCGNNLAITLRLMSEVGRAREFDERSRKALERSLGEDHPYTLCSAANLANDLYLMGEHQAASDLSNEIYERSVRVRGQDHPYTLSCATNLAIDRAACGDEAGAQQLGEDTLVRLRRKFGDRHPAVTDASEGKRAECDIEPPIT